MKASVSHLPKVRDGLEVVPRVTEGGRFRYYVKDPESESIFEFGEEEYFLYRHLDGKRTLPEVLSAFQEHTGIPLEVEQVAAFGRKLHSLGILSSAGDSLYKPRAPRKICLCNPDRIMGLTARAFEGCFSFPFLVIAISFIILSIGVGIKFGQEFIYELSFMRRLFEPLFFLPVAAFAIFIVGPLGELAKGVACKHYGGQVPEFDMLLAFRVFPRFYSEISDIFWYMTKPVRARVLCSGLLLQGLLWGACILAWQGTKEGTGLHTFLLYAVTGSSIFLFLNLLPFIQRDGYYLLNNWLEIPFLHDRSKAFTESWILRKPLPEPLSPRERVIFTRYGFPAHLSDALFWFLIFGFLGYGLIQSMEGVGACIFLILLLLRFEDTLRRYVMKIPFIHLTLRPERGGATLRLVTRIGLVAAFVVLMFVPYPFEVGGDVTLRPVQEQGIRAQVSGEIASVFVREGQWVKTHEPIARLIGSDQRKRVEQVKASLAEARAKLAMLVAGAKPEEIAKAKQEVRAAATSLEYSVRQAERAESMFEQKAIPEKDYEIALRLRDMDRERLESARKDLELVLSGFRKEQVLAAEAEVQRLEVELAHAEEDLDLVTMVSPIEGRIITPNLLKKKGQYLLTGDLFAVVEDPRTLIADIEVPESDIEKVKTSARVRLRTWAYPNTVYETTVKAIAPVAFEKSRGKIDRSLSDREWLVEQNETLRKEGRVVRVIAELDNASGRLKSDMTGYAKIEAGWRPVGVAYTQWLIRFLFVEVWSWIP